MKRPSLVLIGGMALVLALIVPAGAQLRDENTGRLRLGADVGPQFGTADDTAFTIGLNSDYFLTHNFSIGPLLQVGLSEDLFQFGPSLQLKYTFDLDSRLSANVQGGIGLIYAELERRGRDSDDTSFLIPVGPGIEYKLAEGVTLGSTLLFNFMDLNKVKDEDFSVSLLGGIKVRF
jgi:Outer membrane protein beta-barrel domain